MLPKPIHPLTNDVGNNNENASNDDVLSRTDSAEGSNRLVTASRRTNRTCKGVQGMSELERVQENLQELKERKTQNRLEILKDRENRKRKKKKLQQQMMAQQSEMRQQMIAIFTHFTNSKDKGTCVNDGNSVSK